MMAMNELALLGNLLWFLAALGLLLFMAAPLIIWRNTAATSRLLERLLAEQQRTNELLEAIAASARPEPAPDAPPAPRDFTLEED